MMNLKRLEKFLLFFCLLLLPTQLGRHFWPTFSYIYSLPVDYLSPTIYLWDLLSASLFFVFLLRNRINLLALNLLLIFLLLLLPSVVNATNPGASLEMLWRYLVVGMFGVYLASKRLGEIKDVLAFGLVGALVYESVIAVGQFLLGKSLGFWILGERSFNISTPSIATFNYLGRLFLRPYGTFPHPNVLAAFVLITLPLVVFLISEKKVAIKWLLGVLSALTLLLTFSRTAILVGILEGSWFLRKRWKLLLLPFLLLLPILWIRYNSILNFDYLSFTRREDLNFIALLDLAHSPFFGVGLNNFINMTATSDLVAGPTRFLQPVHNIFLLSLSETGLVGFAGLLLLIVFPIVKLWKERRVEWKFLLLTLWGGILFLGLFDHYFLTLPQGQRLLFLVWGLSLAVSS